MCGKRVVMCGKRVVMGGKRVVKGKRASRMEGGLLHLSQVAQSL
jgi:hypothetical protein